MLDSLSMGGYGFYVWTSYAAFGLLLVWDYLAPQIKQRQALRRARMMQRRQSRKAQ